jgi:cysteine-rich repeat protein
VQLDALAVAPDQSMPSHTLRATARVEVKACSAYPPYAAWLTRAASSLLVESPLMRCGDGILDSSESCDDGNDDAGDGCEVNRFNIDDLNAVCLPSPLTCHPDLAETWLAWRCEGVPSRCVQVTCTSPRDDLACGAGPWQPMPSTNASVEARVVVNGRTPGDAPHRAEVLMTSQARCGCEDTGWALRCDGACREAAICAQLTSAPAADLTLARWEGCRQPATSDTCAVDNLSYQQTVNAFFTREAAPSALRAPLPLAEGEQVRGLQAVAASAQGAAWAAFDTVSGVNAVPATQLFYLSPSAPLDAAPTALPSLVGAGGPAKILSISPSDDGQRAWVMASVKGHALWRGQLIEPPLSDVNAEGRVAVHITAAGDLLGVVSLRDEVSSQPLFDSNTPRISTSHASSPTWSAVIAYADILQGELILTAVTDSGDRVWRQVLRGQGGSWITLSGLFTDAQDNVWVSTSAGTFGDDTPYPELSGRGEPLLMQLSPDGASLRWVRSWRLSAGALTADGLGLWTLGYEFVPLSPAPSPLSLRRYDLEGALQVDTPFTAPPFSIDTDLADVRLWPQADGDLIVSRHDPLWALVLSRWTSPDPLQPASTWTRRWVERVETFSPLAPLFPLSPIAIAPSPRDPAQLEVMGRFSTTEGERLVLPLLP